MTLRPTFNWLSGYCTKLQPRPSPKQNNASPDHNSSSPAIEASLIAMNGRTPSRLLVAARQIRHATIAARSARKTPHGEKIWVFLHLQKSNIVYSLTKTLNNNAALSQIPFNGKKTVPAAIRKDLWAPFATIHFSPGQEAVGLSVFQKLREYKRRHELEWDDELLRDEKGKLVKRKDRGRLICDQKANSVADMAAVLSRLRLQEGFTAEKGSRLGLTGEGLGEKVLIAWKDIRNVEFAETWSDNVEHGSLEWHQNNRVPTKVQMHRMRRRLLREAGKHTSESHETGTSVMSWL